MRRATCTAQNLVQGHLRSLAGLHPSEPRIVLGPGMRQSLWQGQKESDAEGSQRSPRGAAKLPRGQDSTLGLGPFCFQSSREVLLQDFSPAVP